MRKEKPRAGIVELHGGDADVEHHAIDAGVAMPRAIASSSEKRPSTSVSRPPRRMLQRGAGGDGRRVAIDGDHGGAGIEDGAAVAARAESAVDEGATGVGSEVSHDLVEKNRNVAGRSASSTLRHGAAARAHSPPPAGRWPGASRFRKSRNRFLASSR